jgi:hypothetical protein
MTQNREGGGSCGHYTLNVLSSVRRRGGGSSLGKLPSTALSAVSMLAMECIIMIVYVYAVELHV